MLKRATATIWVLVIMVAKPRPTTEARMPLLESHVDSLSSATGVPHTAGVELKE